MIEIKELIIKITIQPNGFQAFSNTTNQENLTPQTKQQIIEECVEKVIEILEDKTER